MKNTYGDSVSLTLFGESHGPAVGAVIDGLAPGIPVDNDFIRAQLTKRRPSGRISTSRVEDDEFEILSGVFNGFTTGTPIAISIPNKNVRSADYSDVSRLARPGHADYTAHIKYHGFEDFRGGGHFSGRLTAAVVAAGAIFLSALKAKGIAVGTHIKACAGIPDRAFSDIPSEIEALNAMNFAVLDRETASVMTAKIEAAAKDGDSVGGILETAVIGFPAGVGEPFFGSLESKLSAALFSIPAVKGVQFGDGFALSGLTGSLSNDPLEVSGGKIITKTNRNGGINGGISNGMPIIFSTAIKPTPSIFKQQDTVDYLKNENAVLSLKGRHDPAIVHRARVVQDSITALVLCDELAQRYGTDMLMP